jgi:hypothetical protein
MPVPEHVAHISYIGFRRNETSRECAWWSGADFCFVEMDGWQLDPLPRSAGGAANTVPSIPHTVVDVSRGSGGGRVHPTHITNPGRDSLHSRITLQSGSVTDTCHLGVWTYDPAGDSIPPETSPLSNVVTWTIPDVAQENVELRRRPLRGQGGGLQPLGTLFPDGAGCVELLVAHVPLGAMQAFLVQLNLLSAAAGPRVLGTPVTFHAGAPAAEVGLRSEIEHFRSYYRLLTGIQDQPLPALSTTTQTTSCPMFIWREPRFRNLISPITVNCMVALGSQ